MATVGFGGGIFMINMEMVFCVECNAMMTRGHADKIFKTGFYKTTIPLGHCKDCAYEQNQEIAMEAINNVQDCCTDYITPVGLFV